MKQILLEKIHAEQIDMIKELHKVCCENQINYTVLCGSLLGAIRHKGFIPWDDDMDIALLREDYEKLLEILKKEPIDGCFLQDFSTDEHYYHPYAKLLKNGTVYLEGFSRNSKAKNGVFIDIFPLDYIKKPGDRITEMRRIISRFLTFGIWAKENCHMERVGKKKIINFISVIISILPKKILIRLQRYLTVREKGTCRYAASMFSSNYDTKKLYFEVSDFDEMIELPFESTVVMAPKNWEINLKRLYKNYMQFPPEDKRNSGHDVVEIRI